jgi:excisionase family DNA binding protein
MIVHTSAAGGDAIEQSVLRGTRVQTEGAMPTRLTLRRTPSSSPERARRDSPGQRSIDGGTASLDGYLNPKQAAAYMGIGRTRFYEIVQLEGLRFVRMGNGKNASIRTKREWIEEWMEARTQQNRF